MSMDSTDRAESNRPELDQTYDQTVEQQVVEQHVVEDDGSISDKALRRWKNEGGTVLPGD